MFNPQYSAANTPLPYLLVAGLAHVFGPSLLLARVVTSWTDQPLTSKAPKTCTPRAGK
jgi:hypothetical protein